MRFFLSQLSVGRLAWCFASFILVQYLGSLLTAVLMESLPTSGTNTRRQLNNETNNRSQLNNETTAWCPPARSLSSCSGGWLGELDCRKCFHEALL